MPQPISVFPVIQSKPWNEADEINKARIAKHVFDSITGASYYGHDFRRVLMTNPEAMTAAQTLARCLQAAKVKNSE